MTDGEATTKIGEVIEANTTGFVAECYHLHCAPDFGSFVAAVDGAYEAYGVVSNIQTSSFDPGRRALARGQDEAEPEDVYRHNPELPELLRTQFEVVMVGFADSRNGAPVASSAQGGGVRVGAVRCYLPPLPPRLHAFVYACRPDVITDLTAEFGFLQTVLSTSLGAGRGANEELVAACIRQAGDGRGYDYLVRAGKELAQLLVNDPPRLNAILCRLTR